MTLPKKSKPCFDAGSEYCPCTLALLEECVACSILRGESKCNCGWSGICVYDQFLREGRLIKPSRSSFYATVTDVNEMKDAKRKSFTFTLEVPEPVGRWSIFPGSLIMVRPKDSLERFNVPLSVLNAKERDLNLVFEVVGPKTRALSNALRPKAVLTATGPFWSGLQGQKTLRELASGKVLAVAKGMGQAGIPSIARYIIERGGHFKALLGEGALGKVFIHEELEKLGAQVEILPKEKDHNLLKITREIAEGSYDLIVSGNSDLGHKALAAILFQITREKEKALLNEAHTIPSEDKTQSQKTTPQIAAAKVPRMVWLSNLTMVCADGICGACLKDGFRGCKAVIPMESFFSS